MFYIISYFLLAFSFSTLYSRYSEDNNGELDIIFIGLCWPLVSFITALSFLIKYINSTVINIKEYKIGQFFIDFFLHNYKFFRTFKKGDIVKYKFNNDIYEVLDNYSNKRVLLKNKAFGLELVVKEIDIEIYTKIHITKQLKDILDEK